MASPNSAAPLLKLPAELSNVIYSAAIVDHDDIERHSIVTAARDGTVSMKPPALVQTCRSIRRQAAAIYYGDTTFYVNYFRTGISGLAEWFDILGPDQTRMLRIIRLCGLAIQDVEQATQEICHIRDDLAAAGHELTLGVIWLPVKTDKGILWHNGQGFAEKKFVGRVRYLFYV